MNRIIEPLGNHVLIQPIELPDKSAGGIHLPEQARDHSGEGTVIATGPGRLDAQGRMIPTGVAAGDKVIYLWIHGRDVRLEGRTYKVLDAGELFCKVI